MDISKLLHEVKIENAEVEFKHENEDSEDIVKELTALANSGGGAVVIGVAESGNDFEVTGVHNPQKLEEEVSQLIDQHVSPRIDPTIVVQEFRGESLLTFEVSGDSEVHSYGLNKPYFPARQGSTTVYLDGSDLRYQYRHQSSVSPDADNADETRDNIEQGYLSLDFNDYWLDHGPHFIPKPGGEIASVCTFGELYLPSNPVRMSAIGNRPTMDEVEHALTCLAETFQLDAVRSHFTINQNHGAWIGGGLPTFFQEINSQEQRYSNAGLDVSELYKCEEALYVANTSTPYPESLLLVYIEPWVSENFARKFEIVLLTNGMPVDTKPLSDFSDKAELHFGTAESIDANSKSFPNSQKIPIKQVERIRNRGGPGSKNGETIGFLVENPFYHNGELAERALEIPESTPLAEYQYAFGHFLQLPPEDVSEVVSDRFTVIDYREIAQLPLSALHVDFQLTW